MRILRENQRMHWRHVARSLWRARGFSLLAAATLSIGIACATLMFALVNGMLLQPLPVRQPERLLVAWKRTATGTFSHYPFGADAVREVKQHARSFASVGAFSYNGAMQFPVIEHDVGSYLMASVVDGDFFRVLDVTPLAGRTLTAADDAPGAEPVLVIDERLWQRRYNRSGDIVGRRLRLFDETFTIIGVVPAVDLPRGAEAWFTLAAADARTTSPASREAFRRDQDLIVRLRESVTAADGTAELEALTADFEGRAGRSILAAVKPYSEEVVGEARAPVVLLFAATMVVLVVACANVAILMLLRGEDRRLQLALRVALGATRLRLAQHVALESLLLCILGGAAGLLLARWSLALVVAAAPRGLPRVESLHIDLSVVLFVTVVIFIAAALASLAPLLVSTRATGGVILDHGSRVASPAFRLSRRAFVVAQVALSLTIVSAAGVLTRALLQLQSAEMGFSASRMAFVELFLPLRRYEDVNVRRSFLEQLAERVRAIPGVDAAVPIAVQPYAGLSGWDMPRWVAEGQGPDEAARNPGLDLQSIYPEHFATMGIPITEGRGIDRLDRDGTLRVAVISENAARMVWPGESAVGKRVKWGGVDSDVQWVTIVGVAATTRYRELADPRASIYLPAAQFVDGADSLALRLSVPVESIADVFRERVRALDPNVSVLRTQSFSDLVAGPLSRPRFVSFLANVFGGIALLLATVGLYAVIAAFVRHSSREIGVRFALGASAHHVRALVLREAALLVGIGITLGIVATVAGGRVLTGFVFALPRPDVQTLAIGAVATLIAATIASYVPFRRATRIDPAILLRTD
jgi:predicted permease